jgi:hypothetical protein
MLHAMHMIFMGLNYRVLEALIQRLYSSNQAMTPPPQTGVNEAGKPNLNTDQKIQKLDIQKTKIDLIKNM